MKKRKLIGIKTKKKAVTEIIGTLLLLGISVSLFSIVYLSVLTTHSNPTSPSVNMVCTFDDDNITLWHLGGKDLSLDTKVLLNFNDGSNDEIIINKTNLKKIDENDDGKWSTGEKLVYSNNIIVGNQVEVTVVDAISNSIVMSASIPVINPIITSVNNLAYLQTKSTVLISATSKGVDPDNISLWYSWNGYWEDNFDKNDFYVSSYHNMSFNQGNNVIVDKSSTGPDIEYYEGNITSIIIKKPSNSDWSKFYADVNNRENSTFSILDSKGDPILENLDGNNNDISNDITIDTIRLYGEFNYSVTLVSWNVTIKGEDWNLYSVDKNSPWFWNFKFEDIDDGFSLFYWFYSIGKKSNWADETIPGSPYFDTRCKYQP